MCLGRSRLARSTGCSIAMVPQAAHIAVGCGVSGATVAAVPAGVKAAKFFTSQAPNRSATPSSSRKRVAASLTSNGLCGSLPMGLPSLEEEYRLHGCLRVVAAADPADPADPGMAAREDRGARTVAAQVQAHR